MWEKVWEREKCSEKDRGEVLRRHVDGRGHEHGRGRGHRDAARPPPRCRDPGDNGGGPSDDDDNNEVREEEWLWEDGSDFVPVVYPFTAQHNPAT